MNVKTTIEFDSENEELEMICQTPDPNETPKPGDGDGTVSTGDKEDDEGDVKPYEK